MKWAPTFVWVWNVNLTFFCLFEKKMERERIQTDFWDNQTLLERYNPATYFYAYFTLVSVFAFGILNLFLSTFFAQPETILMPDCTLWHAGHLNHYLYRFIIPPSSRYLNHGFRWVTLLSSAKDLFSFNCAVSRRDDDQKGKWVSSFV